MSGAATPHFNGSDYVPERDDPRLSGQQARVFDLMRDGAWRGLEAISQATGDPPASISAQLRHLRKPRFGGHAVLKRYMGGGLFEYRLVVNQRGKVKHMRTVDAIREAYDLFVDASPRTHSERGDWIAQQRAELARLEAHELRFGGPSARKREMLIECRALLSKLYSELDRADPEAGSLFESPGSRG